MIEIGVVTSGAKSAAFFVLLKNKNMVDVPEFLKWNLYREEKPDSL